MHEEINISPSYLPFYFFALKKWKRKKVKKMNSFT